MRPRPDIVLGPFNERTTPTIAAVVRDENGDAIPGSALTAKSWTLRSEHDESIINGRDEATDGLTVDDQGNLALTPTEADMVVVDRTRSQEWHRLLIAFEYNSGRRGACDIRIVVDRTEPDA